MKPSHLTTLFSAFVLLSTAAFSAPADSKTPVVKPALELTRIYELKHAKAAEVESILRRLLTPISGQSASTQDLSQTAKPFFFGQVGLASDPRVNLLIVLTQAEQFSFFDKLVTALDRPMEDRDVALRKANNLGVLHMQSDKSEYNSKAEELTLSGNVAISRENGSTLRGERIVIKMDTGSITSEGGPPKLVLFPAETK